jgi:hypothetical protein
MARIFLLIVQSLQPILARRYWLYYNDDECNRFELMQSRHQLYVELFLLSLDILRSAVRNIGFFQYVFL